MSNKIIAELIKGTKAGNIELIGVTQADLKRIKGKSLKELWENTPEALYPFGQKLNWYELIKDEGGEVIEKTQRNAKIFSQREVLEKGFATPVLGDHGIPKTVVPVKYEKGEDAEWLDIGTQEAMDAITEKPGRKNLISEVYEIPAIPGKNYKTGEVIIPDTDTVEIMEVEASMKWHAVDPVRISKKAKRTKNGKMAKRLEQYEDLLADAKDTKDEAAIKVYSAQVELYKKLST